MKTFKQLREETPAAETLEDYRESNLPRVGSHVKIHSPGHVLHGHGARVTHHFENGDVGVMTTTYKGRPDRHIRLKSDQFKAVNEAVTEILEDDRSVSVVGDHVEVHSPGHPLHGKTVQIHHIKDNGDVIASTKHNGQPHHMRLKAREYLPIYEAVINEIADAYTHEEWQKLMRHHGAVEFRNHSKVGMGVSPGDVTAHSKSGKHLGTWSAQLKQGWLHEAVVNENWVQGCPVEGQWTGKHIQFKNGGVGRVTDEHTTHVMATVHEPTGVKSVPVLKQHVFSHNDGRYVSEELVSEDHPKSRKISYTDFSDWQSAARSVGAVHHIKHGERRQHLSLYNQNGGRVASFNHETGEGWVNHGHVDEELVSELNKSTLANYIGKASKDAAQWTKDAAAERQDDEPETAAQFYRKARKRQAGVAQAATKLVKEETIVEARKGTGKSFKSLPRRGRTMTGEKADKVDTNPTMKLSTRMANSGQYKGPFT